jgi:apolipoprotein N-acyltransferase
MMNLHAHEKKTLPSFSNINWAINSAILLVFAFPDFDFWYLAYIALIPFFYALEQEKKSKRKSFILGWIWGTTFFFGSCWWLTVPMIETGGIPSPIAYLIVFIVTAIAGLFPALFGLIQSISLKKYGTWAILFAPFIWVFTEFLRYWLTGNNWNAIGYSQAFATISFPLKYSSIGGVLIVSFIVTLQNSIYFNLLPNIVYRSSQKKYWVSILIWVLIIPAFITLSSTFTNEPIPFNELEYTEKQKSEVKIIAIQPNVPTAGLNLETWKKLRQRHIELAELETNKLKTQNSELKTIIVFPESPMNFEYAKDTEMRQFFKDFAIRNKAKVLFNTAEPVYPQYINREPYSMTPEQVSDSLETYNSMVMVDEKGDFEAQYDKIHLLPFGEFIPLPKVLADYVPPVVGNFTFGKEYDILKFGDVNAGLMICFESHFPTLSNQHVRNGADILVEVTNDGYLGNTEVLRQHLASAVFRAVETNRPVLRVTNVGITAYINDRGEVIDPSQGFVEDTRVWTVAKSDGKQTFYVKYGDWFAWFCSFITLALLSICFWKKK